MERPAFLTSEDVEEVVERERARTVLEIWDAVQAGVIKPLGLVD